MHANGSSRMYAAAPTGALNEERRLRASGGGNATQSVLAGLGLQMTNHRACSLIPYRTTGPRAGMFEVVSCCFTYRKHVISGALTVICQQLQDIRHDLATNVGHAQ